LAVANGHTETAKAILELLNGREEDQAARRAQEAKQKEHQEATKTGKDDEKEEKKEKSDAGEDGDEQKNEESEKKGNNKDEDEGKESKEVKLLPQLLDVNADNMSEETPLHLATYYGTY
jgi:ankyrin repeat protein